MRIARLIGFLAIACSLLAACVPAGSGGVDRRPRGAYVGGALGGNGL